MLSRFVRVRSIVAPLGSAVLTMSVLGLVLVGVGQTGARPTLVQPDDLSVLETIGDDVVRDPTGLTNGATELVAPTLIELETGNVATAAVTEDAQEASRQQSLAESAAVPDAPAAEAGSTVGAGESTAGTSAITPSPSPPATSAPITLAFDDGSLARTPSYDDPWSSVVAAMGRGLEPSSGSTTRGVDADTISVAGLVAQTNVSGSQLVGVCDGAAARFARANAGGELSRRIEVLDCADDRTDPTANATELESLIDQETFAVVPLVSPAFLDASPLRDGHVPHVGWGGQAAFCGRDTGYGVTVTGATDCPLLDARGYTALTTPVLTVLHAALGAAGTAATTVVTEASARGAQRAASRELEGGLLGIQVTTLELLPPASATAPDSWASAVREILATDPTLVVLDAATIDGLPEALRRAGYEGEVAWVGTVDPLELRAPDPTAAAEPTPESPGAELLPTPTPDPLAPVAEVTPTPEPEPTVYEPPVADGLIVVSAGVDLAATDSAAWARIVADASRVDVAADDIGLGFVQGYLAADVFVSALRATPEPLTAEAWFDTVNSGWWYGGLGEVACGGWWPAGHIVDHPCLSVARVDHASASLVPLLGLRETVPQFEFRLED